MMGEPPKVAECPYCGESFPSKDGKVPFQHTYGLVVNGRIVKPACKELKKLQGEKTRDDEYIDVGNTVMMGDFKKRIREELRSGGDPWEGLDDG